ncbi:unnamed protein product, partial [Ectocarpus sp. 4 AP-2014]
LSSSSSTNASWPLLTAECIALFLAPAWASLTTRSKLPAATAYSTGVRSQSVHCWLEAPAQMRSNMAPSDPCKMVRRLRVTVGVVLVLFPPSSVIRQEGEHVQNTRWHSQSGQRNLRGTKGGVFNTVPVRQ